jgi:putative protease
MLYNNRIELLSPSGDMESVKAALDYGADAVYVGGEDFGLRINAGFSEQSLIQAAEYVHNCGKKIYLTCNIVAGNSDIEKFPSFCKIIEKSGVDAVIVSDLGIFDIVKNNTDRAVHVSTQAGVMNYACANMLHKLGASRVILAREMSLKEIAQFRENVPAELEIEAFVHGAMCMGFSGRCLISNYLTARDANRGQCAQPCRWNYNLIESTRPNEPFPIEQDERGSYILNSKDLCMIEHIADLVQSGVTCFKIEGRAKTAYHTAVITNAYRSAIDAHMNNAPIPDWVLREVNCVSHRPYCTGFYYGNEDIQNYESSGYIRDCDFVAVADGYNDRFLEITQRNYFTANDFLEVISPANPPQRLEIEYMENSKGERVEIANHAVEKLRIKCRNNREFPARSMIRRVNKL